MHPSTQQAKKYVLVSVLGLLVIATYRGNLCDSKVTFAKRLWGAGVLAIMLGLLADVAPQVAGPFAILTLLGSLTNGGDEAINNALGKVSGGGTSSAAKSKPKARPDRSHAGADPKHPH